MLVGWGRPLPIPTMELLGCLTGRTRAHDFWCSSGIYALHRGTMAIHVGRAEFLGWNLLRHWRADSMAGRWDAFSWLSPVVPDAGDASLLVAMDALLEGAPEQVEFIQWLSQVRSSRAG